jgi:hypothetical protein
MNDFQPVESLRHRRRRLRIACAPNGSPARRRNGADAMERPMTAEELERVLKRYPGDV